MAASNRKPSTVSESAPGDQVDTLREQLRELLKPAVAFNDVKGYQRFLDQAEELFERYSQGVAKEARLDEMSWLWSHVALDEQGIATYSARIAELTGNKPGQTERISKAKGGSK